MITFNHIHKAFNGKSIIQDFSLHIEPKKIYTFFGPNGCGKSTLMNIVAGLTKQERGSIEGQKKLHGKIGYVFQDYRRHLLPWLNARNNITFPLKLRNGNNAEVEKEMAEVLSNVPVKFDLEQTVFTLSGGQAQMISLLRALVIKPELLILDEPFSALDYVATQELRTVLLNVTNRYGLTTLFISHDLDEALYLGDHVVFLTKKPSSVHSVLSVDRERNQRNQLWTTSAEFTALKKKALNIVNAIN